jgi:hypothetical protein
MYSPFTVRVVDKETGKILAQKDVSDSHELLDCVQEFQQLYFDVDCTIIQEPR